VILDHACLRTDGLLEAYSEQLAEGARRELFATTATEWLDVPTVMGHYAALDALKLDSETAFGIGARVGARVHGAFLRTLIQLAGKLGASPWTALAQVDKLWPRSWDGGAIRVATIDDKCALVTVLGTPPCESAFFRSSMSGALHAGVAPLCRSSVVTENARTRAAASFEMRVRWQ
jgi:hypothetical protein